MGLTGCIKPLMISLEKAELQIQLGFLFHEGEGSMEFEEFGFLLAGQFCY